MPWMSKNELIDLRKQIDDLRSQTGLMAEEIKKNSRDELVDLRKQIDDLRSQTGLTVEEVKKNSHDDLTNLQKQNDDLRSQTELLNSQTELLLAEVKRGGRRSLKVDDVVAAIQNTMDPFFRFQNQKIDAISAFFSSEDKVFRFMMDGTPVSFYLPMAGVDRVQNDILRTAYFYQPKPLFFIQSEKLLPKNASVIDAGANIGNHTVFFGRVMEAASIHSFEPNPPAYSILKKNIEINGLEGVVQHHTNGLGERASRARNLNARSNNLGGNNILDDETGDVVVVRLDDLNLPKIDFMKIDVEGRGDGVIKGGLEMIARDKPIMLVEESSKAEKAAIEMLKSDFGYREIWRKKLDLILSP